MKALWIAAAVSMVVPLTAGSDVAFAQSSPHRKPIGQMTCGDFLRVQDDVKPEIVFWLATRDEARNGGIVTSVDDTDSMVPVIVERCANAPMASLTQTVKAETERLRRRLSIATTPTRLE